MCLTAAFGGVMSTHIEGNAKKKKMSFTTVSVLVPCSLFSVTVSVPVHVPVHVMAQAAEAELVQLCAQA